MFKSLLAGAIGVKGSLEDLIGYAKNSGFQGVDVSIPEVADLVDTNGADHVKSMFADAGLKIGAWGCPVNMRSEDAEFQEGLAKLPDFARAGAAVGAHRVYMVIMPGSDERKFGENFRWHLDRVRSIAEVLGEHGCQLGLEFIGPQTLRLGRQYGFLHSIDGMLAFAQAVGTGNVGLLLDCWHWFTGLGTLSDIQALTSDDVVFVHVNDAPDGVYIGEQIDNQRALPSETGIIDLVGFLKVLNKIGYEGPVSAEPFSQAVREMENAVAVQTTHDALDKAWKAAGLS